MHACSWLPSIRTYVLRGRWNQSQNRSPEQQPKYRVRNSSQKNELGIVAKTYFPTLEQQPKTYPHSGRVAKRKYQTPELEPKENDKVWNNSQKYFNQKYCFKNILKGGFLCTYFFLIKNQHSYKTDNISMSLNSCHLQLLVFTNFQVGQL